MWLREKFLLSRGALFWISIYSTFKYMWSTSIYQFLIITVSDEHAKLHENVAVKEKEKAICEHYKLLKGLSKYMKIRLNLNYKHLKKRKFQQGNYQFCCTSQVCQIAVQSSQSLQAFASLFKRQRLFRGLDCLRSTWYWDSGQILRV